MEHKQWTQQEIKYMTLNYPIKTSEELAKEMDRSSPSIRHKASRLGIQAKVRRSYQPSQIDTCVAKLSEFEKGYISAFVDGEGWIGLINNKRDRMHYLQPCIKASNTNKEVIEFLSKIIGAKNVNIDQIKRQNHKPLWNLRVIRLKEVYCFLKVFKPLLIVKRKQAELLFQFCQSRLSKGRGIKYSEFELQLYYEIKSLNH